MKNLELEHFREIEMKKEVDEYENKMFNHRKTELLSDTTKQNIHKNLLE